MEPAGIAVVGAGTEPKARRAPLENLTALGYGGRVTAVHPRHRAILGYECVPSLSDLDFTPDAVVVAVGRDRVLGVIEEAASLGVGGAVVFATGFLEAGPDGAERQRALVEAATSGGMAVVGPNCQGVVNFASPSALYMDTVRAYAPGRVGLVAQSGSVLTTLTNNRRGVRWRYAVSTGNEAVVTAGDVLGYMVDDPDCRLACLFIEAVRDAEHFFDQCDRARERDLPVIVMKAGRSDAGRRAAEAHTGALAVPEKLVDARLRRHGVLPVSSLEELLESAIALQATRRPRRGSIATVAGSGGLNLVIADAADAEGISHPAFAPETVARLTELLPPDLAAVNPLDRWGITQPDRTLPLIVDALAADPSIDIVVSAVDQSRDPTGEGRFQLPLQVSLELAGRRPELFALVDPVGGGSDPERVEHALGHGVALLSGIDTGMRAIRNLVDYSVQRDALARPRAAPDGVVAEPISRTRAYGGVPALELMRAAGMSVVEAVTAGNVEEAVEAARHLGFPVVLKLADEGLTHKTEVGGVVTGLGDPDGVARAAAALLRVGDELLVQPQVRGVEMILGLTRHEELGGFVLVGLGGIWAELFGDAVVAPLGLREGEAEDLLSRLSGARVLDGARGSAPVDRAALVHAIQQLDALGQALGDGIVAVDLNPVMAGPEGTTVVDALVVPRAPVEAVVGSGER